MAIIQFHIAKGIVKVNSDTVTNKELVALGITRKALLELIPRDLATELDEIKARLDKLEGIQIRKV